MEQTEYTYSFNVNSSIEQVTEPLADWEVALAGVAIVLIMLDLFFIISQWRRFGRKSPRLLKYSLAFMYIIIILSMPFTILTTTQAATPSHHPYLVQQFLYCLILSSNYLVLFAKQDALFKLGMAFIISGTLNRRREFLVISFKLQFFGNAIGILILSFFFQTVYTIVLTETETTQTVRVVYILEDWLRILIALGDTSLSIACLMLCIVPLLAFQQRDKVKTRSLHSSLERRQTVVLVNPTKETQSRAKMKKRLYDSARLNFKWTGISIAVTFAFLGFGGSFQPRLNTLWLVFGAFDGFVKVYSIGKMFPKKPSRSAKRRQSVTTKITPKSVVKSASRSILDIDERRKSEHLFDD